MLFTVVILIQILLFNKRSSAQEVEMSKGVILILTGEKECSIPGVVAHLQKIGQPYFRLDTDSFFDHQARLSLSLHTDVVTGSIRCSTSEIELSSIKSVWCRRPRDVRVLRAGAEGSTTRRFVEDEVSSFWEIHVPPRNRLKNGCFLIMVLIAGAV